MADKIKKFFQKKKIDAKFKLAGPGHKLTESSQSSQTSITKKEIPSIKRSGLSQESKVAAEAALARLQQKRDNPSFNTSLAAIKAQVKKELENETASSSKESEVKERREEDVVSKNFAASGVYFKCPLISNDILPRDEWKKNIKTFLYEQLEEERGLTACLIIQSCNANREKVEICVETLCKYLENIVTHPDDEKYQKIRMSNRAFCDRVHPIEGSMELLLAAGFIQEKLFNNEGNEEDFLVFKRENIPSVESLTSLIDALRTAEPIQLELDRNLQVLLPSQAATKVQLPTSFYALSPEEIKREQQLRYYKMMYQLLFLSLASVSVNAHNAGLHSEQSPPLRAIVRLSSPDGHDVHGNITLTQLEGRVHVEGSIYGLPPGHYGFHVHEKGDITNGCGSTGGHFNPEQKTHGHPNDEVRHVGDLGNVEFDSNHISNINFEDRLVALYGPYNVLGRAIVLHEKADDFGRSDHPDSKKTGNAGGRVACGVIGILSPVTGWDTSTAPKTYIPYITTVSFLALGILT